MLACYIEQRSVDYMYMYIMSSCETLSVVSHAYSVVAMHISDLLQERHRHKAAHTKELHSYTQQIVYTSIAIGITYTQPLSQLACINRTIGSMVRLTMEKQAVIHLQGNRMGRPLTPTTS